MRFGLTKNKLFGMNSAVIKTIIVDMKVKDTRTKKSFLIITGNKLKIIAVSYTHLTLPTNREV